MARHVVRYFRPVQTSTEQLSPRKQQLVEAMQSGLSYKMVADRLCISINTVRNHIRRIYEKLEITSKAGLNIRAGR